MTVGRMSAACWIIFGVMCLAAWPLGVGIGAIHALPAGARVVVAILVAGGLWWGPFAYGMYLSMVVIKNGDRRLLRRGTSGTAVVLSAKATRMAIQNGGSSWQGRRVYNYRLRVSVPGRNPYETDCSICAAGIREGSVVNVAVSPRNHRRVMMDVGQGRKDGTGAPGPVPSGRATARTFPAGPADLISDLGPLGLGQPSPLGDQRVRDLARLGQLRRQGILTDTEFAAEKARILSP